MAKITANDLSKNKVIDIVDDLFLPLAGGIMNDNAYTNYGNANLGRQGSASGLWLWDYIFFTPAYYAEIEQNSLYSRMQRVNGVDILEVNLSGNDITFVAKEHTSIQSGLVQKHYYNNANADFTIPVDYTAVTYRCPSITALRTAQLPNGIHGKTYYIKHSAQSQCTNLAVAAASGEFIDYLTEFYLTPGKALILIYNEFNSNWEVMSR
jgi:hypothetical protein